jgi:hypothetical protein
MNQNAETKGVTTSRMNRKEANEQIGRLFKECPHWDWKVRQLAKRIGCSIGTISKCPIWKVYQERKKRLQGEGKIKTTSFTTEMQSVLGSGEKDEILQQLIAEQEQDQREDTGRPRLYLSHGKKGRGTY